ncbi:MAG: DUF4249 family protein [Chloroflexota bacterium]
MKNRQFFKYALIALSGLFIASCENNVDDVTLPYEEKIVISGLIEPGKQLDISLSRTVPALSQEDNNDMLINPLPEVTLTSEGQTWNLVSYDVQFRKYTLQGVEYQEGKTYTLDVKWKNLHAYATTTIPKAPILRYATYKKVAHSYGDGYIDTTYLYYVYFTPENGGVYRGGYNDINGSNENYWYGGKLSNGKNVNSQGYSAVEIETYGNWMSPEMVKENFKFVVDAFDPIYEKYYDSRYAGDSPNDIFGIGGTNIRGNVQEDGIGIFIGRNRAVKPAKDLIK